MIKLPALIAVKPQVLKSEYPVDGHDEKDNTYARASRFVYHRSSAGHSSLCSSAGSPTV